MFLNSVRWHAKNNGIMRNGQRNLKSNVIGKTTSHVCGCWAQSGMFQHRSLFLFRWRALKIRSLHSNWRGLLRNICKQLDKHVTKTTLQTHANHIPTTGYLDHTGRGGTNSCSMFPVQATLESNLRASSGNVRPVPKILRLTDVRSVHGLGLRSLLLWRKSLTSLTQVGTVQALFLPALCIFRTMTSWLMMFSLFLGKT